MSTVTFAAPIPHVERESVPAPKHNANLGLQYDFPAMSWGYFSARLDLSYTDKFVYHVFNNRWDYTQYGKGTFGHKAFDKAVEAASPEVCSARSRRLDRSRAEAPCCFTRIECSLSVARTGIVIRTGIE